jgi:hypothetical protein
MVVLSMDTAVLTMLESENTEKEIKALLAADDPAALDLIWRVYASDLLGYLVLAHTTDSSPVARSAVPERESAAVQETADLWAMTGRAQFASLHRRTAAMPNADAADLLARHLRALAAELLDDRPNGG